MPQCKSSWGGYNLRVPCPCVPQAGEIYWGQKGPLTSHHQTAYTREPFRSSSGPPMIPFPLMIAIRCFMPGRLPGSGVIRVECTLCRRRQSCGKQQRLYTRKAHRYLTSSKRRQRFFGGFPSSRRGSLHIEAIMQVVTAGAQHGIYEPIPYGWHIY